MGCSGWGRLSVSSARDPGQLNGHSLNNQANMNNFPSLHSSRKTHLRCCVQVLNQASSGTLGRVGAPNWPGADFGNTPTNCLAGAGGPRRGWPLKLGGPEHSLVRKRDREFASDRNDKMGRFITHWVPNRTLSRICSLHCTGHSTQFYSEFGIPPVSTQLLSRQAGCSSPPHHTPRELGLFADFPRKQAQLGAGAPANSTPPSRGVALTWWCAAVGVPRNQFCLLSGVQKNCLLMSGIPSERRGLPLHWDTAHDEPADTRLTTDAQHTGPMMFCYIVAGVLSTSG